MKIESLQKRLASLEGEQDGDLVCIGHQWFDRDGKSSSEYIENWVPRSKAESLKPLFDKHDENEDEEQPPGPGGPYLQLVWREKSTPEH